MTENKDGWSWFLPDSNEGTGEILTDNKKELAQNYARCFSTADGKRVLAHLHSLTLDRALGPGVKSGLLRHLEGQRQLVTYISAQIRRGQQGK